MSDDISSSATAPVARGVALYDCAAFLAVLVTGMVLIMLGHASPEVLGGYTIAVTALYSSWRGDARSPLPQGR